MSIHSNNGLLRANINLYISSLRRCIYAMHASYAAVYNCFALKVGHFKPFSNFGEFFFSNGRIFNKKNTTIFYYFFQFRSYINLSWGHVRPHIKFGPDWVSRLDVYWLQTNKQKDRQVKYID